MEGERGKIKIKCRRKNKWLVKETFIEVSLLILTDYLLDHVNSQRQNLLYYLQHHSSRDKILTLFKLMRYWLKVWIISGTAVTCWKPSSGFCVVWLDIPLRGRVRPSAMKSGDQLKVLLPLSHFTRALDQAEWYRTEESLDIEKVVWTGRKALLTSNNYV